MPRKRYQGNGDPALKTYARKQLRARILAEVKAGRRGCEKPLCLMPTRTIAWRAPHTNPWSLDLDEIVPRYRGGSAEDPNNVRPTHARCNRSHGQAITTAKLRARAAAAVTERGLDVHLDDW